MNPELVPTPFGAVNRNWELVPLEEHVFFQEGPGLRKWQWTDSGMKVINVTNILEDGRVNISNTGRFISLDEFEQRYSHFAVEDGDIVVASSGNTYGKVGRINSSHLPLMMNTSVIRLHPRFNETVDSGYLYGFLRSHLFRNQIESLVIGSAQPNFGPSHLRLMKLVLPPLSAQHRIADILSAYDDLIANNTRRIAILEEMAQRLYREWFVHFRFPGHEQVAMVGSELGAVPEGWELRKLEDVVELAYGKALKAEDRKEGSVPVYGSSGIVGRHDTSLVDGPGIIVGRKGNVGSVHWSDTNFYPIDTVYYVRSALPLHYVYFNLRYQNFINNDAAVPGLSRGQAYGLTFLVPSAESLSSFAAFVSPVFDTVSALKQKNHILRQTRDLLLPRLVSGELQVMARSNEVLEAIG